MVLAELLEVLALVVLARLVVLDERAVLVVRVV